MNDEIPTTDEVLSAFAWADNYDPYYEGDVSLTPDGQLSLNRAKAWLAEVERAAAEKAWDVTLSAIDAACGGSHAGMAGNPYRKETR